MPNVRGRSRLFLELFNVLGLKSQHTEIIAELTEPVRYKAKLDLHSWLQRIAFLTGGYEPNTVLKLLELHGRSGHGYLLDVGANIGLISIPFVNSVHDVPPDSPACYSFELVPDNYCRLQENIALNNKGHLVGAFNIGLGDIEDEIEFQIEGYLAEGQGTGTANILSKESRSPGARIKASIRTLDDVSAELRGRCSVIKIDVDGYDLKVLQGAKQFLATHRPIILGEFAPYCLNWHGQSRSDVETFAAENSYFVSEWGGDLILEPT